MAITKQKLLLGHLDEINFFTFLLNLLLSQRNSKVGASAQSIVQNKTDIKYQKFRAAGIKLRILWHMPISTKPLICLLRFFSFLDIFRSASLSQNHNQGCGSGSVKNPPLSHRRKDWSKKRNWFCYSSEKSEQRTHKH